MKKYFFLVALIPFIVSSCKTKDNNPPLMFLNGDDPMTVILESEFKDPGATADDNFDGATITNKIESTHNIPNTSNVTTGDCITKEHGDWTVTYTVADKAGNQTSKTRTVKVRNSSSKYAVSEYGFSCIYNFSKSGDDNMFPNFSNQSVSMDFDKRYNNRVYFTKLCGKPGLRVYANIENDTVIYIPDQSKIFVENTDSVLYRVRGENNQCWVLDTMPTSFHLVIKYMINRYTKSPNTSGWLYDDVYWLDDKYSICNETYIQWE